MDDSKYVNIASHLPRMAELEPDKPAVIMPYAVDGAGRTAYIHYTLKQLDDDSSVIAHGLSGLGIKRGARTVLMVTPSLDFFSLTFALFKIGAVPVMVDPGIGLKNMKPCLDEAEPEAFIGIPKAHAARVIFGWGKKTIRFNVTAGKKFFWGGRDLGEIRKLGFGMAPYPTAKTTFDETAAILFTSGSTGTSKGAVYSHGIFDAQVRILKDVYGIKPGELDLATFPLFALFGPALGMAALIPDMDASKPVTVDPEKIITAIRDYAPTNMFASPALINKIGVYAGRKGIKFKSLKRVISAGAPARIGDLEMFSKLLGDGVEIYTPYGATEALPVCNIGSGEILAETAEQTRAGKGNCVGLPVPGIELKIIRITDEPIPLWSDGLVLPSGEIGEIAVSGINVTKEYFNRTESTKQAKILDEERKVLYHRMGDVGYMDDRGRIWFCGRKSHRVILDDGETLFTIPVEAVFNNHNDVFRTALVGIKKAGKTIPVLCVETKTPVNSGDQDRIKRELSEISRKFKHTEKIKTFLFHPLFPVDPRHNAKIFREKLTIWAGSKIK